LLWLSVGRGRALHDHGRRIDDRVGVGVHERYPDADTNEEPGSEATGAVKKERVVMKTMVKAMVEANVVKSPTREAPAVKAAAGRRGVSWHGTRHK